MSCSKLSEPRRVSSQMERTNDIWVGAMLSLARLVVAPPFCSGATIFMKNLWSARFLQAGLCWRKLGFAQIYSESFGDRSPLHDESRARQTSKGPQHPGAEFFTRFLARPLSRLCLHVLASQNQEVTA
jgi:hypothetical protein